MKQELVPHCLSMESELFFLVEYTVTKTGNNQVIQVVPGTLHAGIPYDRLQNSPLRDPFIKDFLLWIIFWKNTPL